MFASTLIRMQCRKIASIDMSIKTLLVVMVALCLQESLVLSVVLELLRKESRSIWGANNILLVCLDDDMQYGDVINAIFTRKGDPIAANDTDDCTPSDTIYCVEEDGSRLHFVVSSGTEGWFACENNANVTSASLAIIGEHFIVSLRTIYVCILTYRV